MLTIESMPSAELSEHLVKHGCTYAQLRKRGMDLWNLQTVTMEDRRKLAALESLELRLRDNSLLNCVRTFREVLTGHEHVLFDRYLFVVTVTEQVDCGDEACMDTAMRCLASERRSRGIKRKHDSASQADGVQGFCPGTEHREGLSGAKRARAHQPNFEEVVVMVGLAGLPVSHILSSGVSLYCEAQRRPNMIAEKYATKAIQERIPQATPRCLLHFFYCLLGDTVFALLGEDLCTKAAARSLTAIRSQDEKAVGVPGLISAYREVLERRAQNCTPFERRCRVRQLAEAASTVDPAELALTFYAHLAPGEREAWGQQLHILGCEDLWRPL